MKKIFLLLFVSISLFGQSIQEKSSSISKDLADLYPSLARCCGNIIGVNGSQLSYHSESKIRDTWFNLQGNPDSNGKLINEPSFSNDNGGYFTLNGLDQIVTFPSPTSANKEYTFAGWFNFPRSGYTESIITRIGGPGTASLALYKRNNEKITVYNRSSEGRIFEITSSESVNPNTWYYLAVTYKANELNGLKLFINGKLSTTGPTGDIVSGQTWNLGIENTKIRIASFELYSSLNNEVLINLNYNTSKALFSSFTPSLIPIRDTSPVAKKSENTSIAPIRDTPAITKKSETKWDFGCVANSAKRIGFPSEYLSSKNSILGNNYTEAMASGEKIAFISVGIEADKINKWLLFNDLGGVRILKRNTEKKLEIEYEGEWACINSNNVKLNARSLVNKNEVLYFNTESMEMESKFDTPENVKRNDPPVNKAESVDDALAREIKRSQEVFTRWGAKPDPISKESPKQKVGSNKKSNESSTTDNEEVWTPQFKEKMKQMFLRQARAMTGGNQYYPPKDCSYCNGKGIMKTCWYCSGKGNVYCRTCKGRKYTNDGRVCIDCNGNGLVLCRYCKGKRVNVKCTHLIIDPNI